MRSIDQELGRIKNIKSIFRFPLHQDVAGNLVSNIAGGRKNSKKTLLSDANFETLRRFFLMDGACKRCFRENF